MVGPIETAQTCPMILHRVHGHPSPPLPYAHGGNGNLFSLYSFVIEGENKSWLWIAHRRMAWGVEGVEDGRKSPAWKEGHPSNSCKAVSGAARLQDIQI
jgi:hypothetical protein